MKRILVKEVKHIVNRVFVTIETIGGFKPEISNEEIISAIRNALNDCNFQDSNKIFRVDRLNVNVFIPERELHLLNERLSELLLEEINLTIRDNGGEFINIIHQQYSDFLEYLRSGRMPWTSGSLIYESHFLQDAVFRQDLNDTLKNGKLSIDRLIFKLDFDQLHEVLDQYYDKSFCGQISELIKKISRETGKLKKAYDLEYRVQKYLFQEIFYSLFLENHKPEAMGLIKESLPGILLKTGIKEEDLLKLPFSKKLYKGEKKKIKFSADTDVASKDEEKSSRFESIQVSNVGIVLLHPFLKQFFSKLGLVEGKDFQNEFCRERAVCLLHYLGTGETKFPAEKLAFAKFLCHFPLHHPVPEQLPISPFEMVETDNLLQSVIDHWNALKNTSIGGLRINFFHRLGLLQKEDDVWTLIIEKQTSDILIDRLPWPVSPVKLPWMPGLLTVKWN